MECTGWIIKGPASNRQTQLFFLGCIQPRWTVHCRGELEQLALDMGFAHSQACGKVDGTFRQCEVYSIYARRERVDEWERRWDRQILGFDFTWNLFRTTEFPRDSAIFRSHSAFFFCISFHSLTATLSYFTGLRSFCCVLPRQQSVDCHRFR